MPPCNKADLFGRAHRSVRCPKSRCARESGWIVWGERAHAVGGVPESGVSEGLALGAPVSLPGLGARPWESVFNGQQRHGIAYRAAAVTPGVVPAGTGA